MTVLVCGTDIYEMIFVYKFHLLFLTVQFQSCDANVDFSLELSGRGVLVRLASLVLQSNAVTSVLQTGIEQAVSKHCH